MKFRSVVIVALFLWLLHAVPPSLGANPPEPVSIVIHEVLFEAKSLPWVGCIVTVTDRSGRVVKGLTSSDFGVVEDGVPSDGGVTTQPLAAMDSPVCYSVVLDHREDLPTSLTLVNEAVDGFISELGFRHPGTVVSDTDRPRIIGGPTQDAKLLAGAVLSLEPVTGAPRLFDGMMLGLEAWERDDSACSGARARRAMVVLTDGTDEGSLFSLEAVAAKLAENGANLYVVAYGDAQRPESIGLPDLCRNSGGRYWFVSDPDDLLPTLVEAADELKNQYVLTFPATRLKADGKVHRLQVLVRSEQWRGEGRLMFVSPQWGSRLGAHPAVLGGGAVTAFVGLTLLVRRLRRKKGPPKGTGVG